MSNQLIRSRIPSFREGIGNFNFFMFGHHLEILAPTIANFDAFTSSRGECQEGCGKIKGNRFKEGRTSSTLITRVLRVPLENCGAFGTTKQKMEKFAITFANFYCLRAQPSWDRIGRAKKA